MVNTQGFQTVAQITEAALLNILQEAWRSGGDDSGAGVLPESIDLPAGASIGPYQLADGTVRIPQEQIRISLNPAINGINLILGLEIDLEIANPPIPSARLFNITADATIRAPLGTAPDPGAPVNLALLFEGLPADAVSVTITSGDPLAPVIAAAPEEIAHKLYQDEVIPHLVQDIPVPAGPFSMLASIQFFDDETDPARRITVAYPAPGQIRYNLPCYLRFYNISGSFGGFSLASPMGINAIAQLTMPFSNTPGHMHIGFDAANAQLVGIMPGAGVEGANYSANKALIDPIPLVPSLDELIQQAFANAAAGFFAGMPPFDVDFPTVTDIENYIEDFVRTEMNARRYVIIWAPEGEVADISIDSITPKVLPNVLAIAINAGPGANADALVDFTVPPCVFAIGLDDDFILGKFSDELATRFPDGFPVTLPPEETDGRNVRLDSINFSLIEGAIRISGHVTLVDAILDSIDVGAGFTVDFGLRWVDNPDGGQILEPFPLGDPDIDIDLDLLGWILVILTGFVFFGVIGAIVFAIILAIILEIAGSIGSGMFRDAISNQVTGIAAWPVTLPNIGTIQSAFKNPVDICPTGIKFIGDFIATSSMALTAIDFSNAHGPYSMPASMIIPFNGGLPLPVSTALWHFGDGNTSLLRSVNYRYGDSGLYVAKLRIEVNETGGVTTRNFTPVRLINVPPVVTLPAEPLRVLEGETFELTGHFTDSEWLDKHSAIFDWGDNSKPTVALVNETNEEPQAIGTATAGHAYCDNGEYTVRLTVIDDDGGVGEATMRVIVENVAPRVKAPEKLCVLTGQKVVMQATFEDDGWCDTHIAFWNFGDCETKNAMVWETHTPPKGLGKAEACHVWQHCGRYLAEITVVDDDGGVGSATTIVNAVSLQNPNMENGFRLAFAQDQGRSDQVANEWMPYAEPLVTLDKKAQEMPREWRFFAEQYVERESRRAQGIDFRGAIQAGIYQSICVNEGWDYEFTAHYHLIAPRRTAQTRIGIDPTGGVNPNNPAIVWRELGPSSNWENITVRATAQASQITLFIGGIDYFGGQNTIYIDKTHLCMIQPMCPPAKPEPPCKELCIDFEDLNQFNIPAPASLNHHGLAISSPGNLWTVDWGEPAGKRKLAFSGRGVEVILPEKVQEVKVTVMNYAGKELRFDILNGGIVVGMVTASVVNEAKEVTLSAAELDGFRVLGSHSESGLVKICYCSKRQRSADDFNPTDHHGK
ncbi:MAG: hypothetical protein JNK77_00450 [Saprospiraceae bacterium]|nr:hypothetical protein [Saprospiraceae bacterium]